MLLSPSFSFKMDHLYTYTVHEIKQQIYAQAQVHYMCESRFSQMVVVGGGGGGGRGSESEQFTGETPN